MMDVYIKTGSALCETKYYNGKFSGKISVIVRDIFGGETQWTYKKDDAE